MIDCALLLCNIYTSSSAVNSWVVMSSNSNCVSMTIYGLHFLFFSSLSFSIILVLPVLFCIYFLVRTRGTGPQLRAHIGGRTRRRRPNLWAYGWSILVIRLDIKQARTFIDQGFLRVSLCIFIVGYLNTFSNYCKTVLRIIKKTFVFFHWCRLQFAWC